MNLMMMPEQVYRKVQSAMKEFGYTKEWEVISSAIENFQRSSPTTISIMRGSSDNNLVDIIQNILSSAKRTLYIAVQVLDNQYIKEIKEALSNGVDVRIIIGLFDENWLKGREKRDRNKRIIKNN